MSKKKSLIAEKIIEVNAPIEKVWTVITTDVYVVLFMMGMKPITSWKKGADIYWTGRHEGEEHNMAKGKVLESDPMKSLRYTFFFGGYGHADIPENYQTVSFELNKLTENQTILTVQQGDYSVFEEGETYLQHASDFWQQAGDKLKEICESDNVI